jgi:hypothetical protein
VKLVPGADFWQDNIGRRYTQAKKLAEQPGGACFRYACKWLLCKLYAKPFKTYDAALTGRPLSEDFSATSGYDKQEKYLQAMAPYEKPNTAYADFLAAIRAESKRYLEIWGNKTDAGGVKYAISVQERGYRSLAEAAGVLGADASLIVGIVGINRKHLTVKGKAVIQEENWAHAFAYYRRGNEKRFFDSNGGEFDLGADDPAKAIEQYSNKYYAGFEKNYAWLESEVDIGTPTQPKRVRQFERDTSQRPTDVLYAKGFKSIYNYVLFEVTRN